MILTGTAIDTDRAVALAKAHIAIDLSKALNHKLICIKTEVCLKHLVWVAKVELYYDAYNINLN